MKKVSGGLWVKGVIDGDKGDASVVYDLLPSPDKIAFGVDSDNHFTPSAGIGVTCGYTKTVGGTTTSGVQPDSGKIDGKYYICYRLLDANGTPIATYSGNQTNGWDWLTGTNSNLDGTSTVSKAGKTITVKPGTTCSALEFCLRSSSASTVSETDIIARKTVPIIRSGLTGGDGSPGSPGNPGRDAAVLEFTSGNPVLFKTDSSGVTAQQQNRSVDLRIRTAGGTAVPTTANITVPSSYGNIAISTPTNGVVYLNVAANVSISDGSITVSASGTIGGVVYNASGTIVIACNRTGVRGAIGPWVYYDGPWKSDRTYNKDAGTPFVKASDRLMYILSGASSSLNQNPTNVNYQNGSPWEVMTYSFKYLVAEMVFSLNAQFGGFVFNHDWMISISGTIGGTHYYSPSKDEPAMVSGESVPAYTHFNPSLPDGKMDVPVSTAGIVSTATNVNAVFSLLGGHSYSFAVTISGRSSSNKSLTIDIYLRRVGSNTNLDTLTVDHNGRFTLPHLYSPATDVDVRICTVCSQGLTASVAAIMVMSDTVFVPNFAVDGLTGRTYQNDAHVAGVIKATSLFASDGLFSTQILPGVAEFRSVLWPLSVLRLGADDDGMLFQMTDKNGRMIWNLGGSSNGIGSITSGGGDYTSVYYKQMSGSTPAKHEFENVTRDDCIEYYRYNGQWATANGARQFAEGEAAKDGIVHTVKTSVANASLITAGYYVEPNNGVFLMEAQHTAQNDSGAQQKTVKIYRFASGKIAETISYKFY